MEFQGEKLKLLRETKKLRMVDVANMTGIGQGQLSQIENGVIKNPRMDTVKKICDAMDVDQQYFYIENARLPVDVLPELTKEVVDFITDEHALPYIVLSERAMKAGLPTEVMEQLIEVFEKSTQIAKAKKKGD